MGVGGRVVLVGHPDGMDVKSFVVRVDGYRDLR